MRRRLVQFLLEDPEPLVYHNEPILRDGEQVGYLTSGNYGHWLGGAVGLGYVNNPDGVSADFVNSGSYEIEIACERFPGQGLAQALLRPQERARKDVTVAGPHDFAIQWRRDGQIAQDEGSAERSCPSKQQAQRSIIRDRRRVFRVLVQGPIEVLQS